MSTDTVSVLTSLEEGDRVLYSGKKTPLTVASVEDEEVTVEGPQGGEYLLFVAPDDSNIVLESQSGNKEYARKVEDLRVVGEWLQTGDGRWEHTESGAVVELAETDAEYWTLDIQGFDGEEPDIPLYGFMKKKFAVEEAQDFMDGNPEG